MPSIKFMKSGVHRIRPLTRMISLNPVWLHGRHAKMRFERSPRYLKVTLKLTVNRQQEKREDRTPILAHSGKVSNFPRVVHSSWLLREIQMKKLKGTESQLKWMTRRNSGRSGRSSPSSTGAGVASQPTSWSRTVTRVIEAVDGVAVRAFTAAYS